MKDIHDKLAELLAYGVLPNDIIHWTHIFNENKLDISVLGNDLREYGNVKAALQ